MIASQIAMALPVTLNPTLLADGPALWDWSIDGWIIATAMLCSLSGALLGCFLVLRRLSLLGDAISHAVLPGIVGAYWLTGSVATLPMWLGAIAVGLLTVWLTEATRNFGRVDESASTGIVFTGLFAVGLVMVVRLANSVDLDLSCVLFGNLENVSLDTRSFLGWEIPRSVFASLAILIMNVLVVVVFRKELQITTFDAGLANSMGISPVSLHYLLASLVAITSVSSFEAVGNILIVAMFIVPPSTAFLLTKKLSSMLWLSCLIGMAASILGHIAAITIPRWFGFGSTSSAAMMTIVSALFLLLAILFGPRDGLLFKLYERWWLANKILSEDILAALYRNSEQSQDVRPQSEILKHLLAPRWRIQLAIRRLLRHRLIERPSGTLRLTELGAIQAQNLVRSHRLWEQFLSVEARFDSSKIHDQAESLEHFTSRRLREKLEAETAQAVQDPHGRPIPPEV